MTTKRALDLGILFLSAPLWVPLTGALALSVMLADGTPVFFTQLRVGQGGRTFRILKLRSMTTHATEKERVPTVWGQWLRQRGLDELPQLINVLKGDMSLVGPRPLTHDDLARLSKLSPTFADRLQVAPGITGLSQVCQARGAMLTAHLDAQYARERTALLDLGILFRTAYINVVGKQRGARRIPSYNT